MQPAPHVRRLQMFVRFVHDVVRHLRTQVIVPHPEPGQTSKWAISGEARATQCLLYRCVTQTVVLNSIASKADFRSARSPQGAPKCQGHLYGD